MTSDKYAAMLLPLGESCIPKDILRIWLRNPSVSTAEKSYSKSSRVSDIDPLLGADAIGLIYTGKLIKLECSLTAVRHIWISALMGIIERDNETNNDVYYMPHRPVLTPAKTNKIPSVFNATAREGGKPSLNDVHHKGFSLIELIPEILDFVCKHRPTSRH
ncbi:hypothetical protein TNIN_313861 [Trichonephila inaurata madagascariensis]|uniref:Uncharacterized protein n=1 Tax=Trichonephila inaurata madagascariensis TaxID=2747483 RepID=A0A8X6XV00_9ARAC|nr:hypothetical protein TNIN_313861 [Trichonephila inaurata madagascariensis]